MRKILLAILVLAAVTGLVLYSLPNNQQAAGADYFATTQGAVRLVQAGETWERVKPAESDVDADAYRPSVWYMPLSTVDGIYFYGANTGAVSLRRDVSNTTTVTLVASGAFVVSANDPFSSYVVEDFKRSYRAKVLQNGTFAVVSSKDAQGLDEIRVYSYSAILSFALLADGKPVTTLEIYPGTLLRYSPDTAPSLLGADAWRVSQVNPISFADPREDGCRTVLAGSADKAPTCPGNVADGFERRKVDPNFAQRVFGDDHLLAYEAFLSDFASQVRFLKDLFAQRKSVQTSSDLISEQDPLNPSALLLNRRKEAVALQNLLLRRLNDVAADPGKFGKEYLTQVLDKISEFGPQFRDEALALVRKYYLLYLFTETYDADQNVLLGSDGFTAAIRDFFGCELSAPYFSGVSNLFLAYLMHTALPPEGAAQRLERDQFDALLRTYVGTQMALGQKAAVETRRGPERSQDADSCAAAPGITAANVRSFWVFLVQYFDRERSDAAPTASTLRLAEIMMQLGRTYLDSITGRDAEFRKTEIQTAVRYYRSIFKHLMDGVESDFFSSTNPYVFREDKIQGNDLQIDRDVQIGLQALSDALKSAADGFTSPGTMVGASESQMRSVRGLVEARFRPEVVVTMEYLRCVLANDHIYRFAPDPSTVCRAAGAAAPAPQVSATGGVSGVGAELRANVSASGSSIPAPRPRRPVAPPPVPAGPVILPENAPAAPLAPALQP